MSLRYRDSSGNETIVSGLTPGGDIEAGAMAERSGNYSLTSSVVGWVKQTITFDSPLPDNDYTITFEEHSAYGHISGPYLIENKTANGFTVGVFFTEAIANNMSGTYRAFKTYSVQHAAQNAEDIANILSVIPSNATSANKLATQSDLENVEIDVDDALSASSTNPVQNKIVKAAIDTKQDKVFIGTTAEWEALSTIEQNKYTLVNLTDDGETGNEENYSTSEVRTNKKWIDGKLIYRKVVELSSQLLIQPNAGWINMCSAPSGITNLVSCNVKQNGNCDWTAGAFYRFYQGYIQAYPISSITMGITQVVIEYTKTD